MHYRGTLISDQPFGSSDKRGKPATFKQGSGWEQDIATQCSGGISTESMEAGRDASCDAAVRFSMIGHRRPRG